MHLLVLVAYVPYTGSKLDLLNPNEQVAAALPKGIPLPRLTSRLG